MEEIKHVSTNFDDALGRPLREGPGSFGQYVTTTSMTIINGISVATQCYNVRLLISKHIITYRSGSLVARITWLDACGKLMTFNYYINDDLSYRRPESILR